MRSITTDIALQFLSLMILLMTPTAELLSTGDTKVVRRIRAVDVRSFWGDWGTWTGCSRSCGGGIASQVRPCLRRRRSGTIGVGRHCVGLYRQYKQCNIKACSNGDLDFRMEQCEAYNNKPFMGKIYSWEALVKEPMVCELNCHAKGYHFYAKLADKVVDGTICQAGSSDVCINGMCKKVGCNGVLGSGQVYDKCGVCGGDNTQCEIQSGVFDTVLMKVGYNLVVTIPEGAMHINVTELAQSRNYLALMGADGEEYINGNWRVLRAGNYSAAGTVFQYRRTTEGRTGKGQQFLALGPTNKELQVQVIFQKANMGIAYEYVLQRKRIPETPQPSSTADNSRDYQTENVDELRSVTPQKESQAVNPSGNLKSVPRKDGNRESIMSSHSTEQKMEGNEQTTEASHRKTSHTKNQRKDKHDPSKPKGVNMGLTSPDLPANIFPNPVPGHHVDSGGLWSPESSTQHRTSEEEADSKLTKNDGGETQRHEEHTTESPGVYAKIPQYPRRHQQISEQNEPPNVRREEETNTDGNNNGRQTSIPIEGMAQSAEVTQAPSDSDVALSVAEEERLTTDLPLKHSTGDKTVSGSQTTPMYGRDTSDRSRRPPSDDQPASLGTGDREGGVEERQTVGKQYAGFPNASSGVPSGTQQGGGYSSNPTYPLGGYSAGMPQVINPYKPGIQIPNSGPQTGDRNPVGGGNPLGGQDPRGGQNRQGSGYDTPTNIGYPPNVPQQGGGGGFVPRRDSYAPDNGFVQGGSHVPINGAYPSNQGGRPQAGGDFGTNGGRRTGTQPGKLPPVLNPYKPGHVSPTDRIHLWQEVGISDCTATCAGGTQQRLVICFNMQTGLEAEPSLCDIRFRPPMKTVLCNSQPCPAMWEVGVWSQCSSTCGRGMQMRQVVCKQKKSSSLTTIVDMENCNPTELPIKMKECVLRRCTAWKVGGWKLCSALCGDGTQSRDVTCIDDTMTEVDESNCEGQRKPDQWIACSVQQCDTKWFMADWPDQCSRDCGGGQKIRNTICTTIGHQGNLGDTHCDISKKPRSIKACNNQACDAKWYTSEWSQCSEECDTGVQSREVLCISAHPPKIILDDSDCSGSKPEDEQKCELKACSPMWLKTNWSECSKTCGSGLRTRDVKCMTQEETPSTQCNEEDRPDDKQQCNTMQCTLLTQPSSSCTDRYTYCMKVAQARLCSYPFYKKYCCISCYRRYR